MTVMETQHGALARLGRMARTGFDPAAAEGYLQDQIMRLTGQEAPAEIVVLPRIVNVTTIEGQDLALEVTVTGEDLDLTGRPLLAQIPPLPGGDLLGAWVPVLDTAGGVQRVELALTSAVSSALGDGTFKWDFWVCDFPVSCFARGTLTLEPRISQCPPA
jgi:hypothetical protein